jgi:hypothetical protein
LDIAIALFPRRTSSGHLAAKACFSWDSAV